MNHKRGKEKKREDKDRKAVTIEISGEDEAYLKKVAALARVSVNDAMCVILAVEILKSGRDLVIQRLAP